jgi:sugar lactone lactonase YvrE
MIRTISTYDFDAATCTISNRRPFVYAPDEPGYPDGLTVDSEGFVWSARILDWRVIRYDPKGNVEREIRLPVKNPTSCAFGGKNLDELYVTTAWIGLSDEDRRQQPLAGGLFRIRTGIKGVEECMFAG